MRRFILFAACILVWSPAAADQLRYAKADLSAEVEATLQAAVRQQFDVRRLWTDPHEVVFEPMQAVEVAVGSEQLVKVCGRFVLRNLPETLRKPLVFTGSFVQGLGRASTPNVGGINYPEDRVFRLCEAFGIPLPETSWPSGVDAR